jgi:hypothetical protein
VREHEVEAPGVGDVLGNVLRDEGGREIGDVFEPVRQLHVLDEIGGARLARLLGLAVEDAQGRARGHEVDVVALESGGGISVPIVSVSDDGAEARARRAPFEER